MENHKQQHDAIEICTLPCKHINPKVERFKVSVFYEDNPCWIKGWHLMIESQCKTSNNTFETPDYDGYCFAMIPDDEKSESLKKQAISEAKNCAIILIRKLVLGVLLNQ